MNPLVQTLTIEPNTTNPHNRIMRREESDQLEEIETTTNNHRSSSSSSSSQNGTPRFKRHSFAGFSSSITSITSSLQNDKWSEPDSNSFRVRNRTYMSDKKRKKESAGPSLFRLLTVDFVRSETGPITEGLCLHPQGKVQRALRRELEGIELEGMDLDLSGGKTDTTAGLERCSSGLSNSSSAVTDDFEMPPFLFAVNIAVPGGLHFVFYYAVDSKSLIDGSDIGTKLESPSSSLLHKFFFGESDKFRDETFKLVPRIQSGNIVVKKAVGSKPTLIGTKLKQSYVRRERFMELYIDIGSDAIANKVVKLVIGYAKTLVVDMAFMIEGKHELELPERIMGTVQLKNVDFKRDWHAFNA